MNEIDYIILKSISDYGHISLPQDYFFLKKYQLLNYYNEIISRKSSVNCSIHYIDRALRSEAFQLAKNLNIQFSDIKKFVEKYGTQYVKKELLKNNKHHIRTLIVIMQS